MKILGISGSLRKRSYNSALLEEIALLVPHGSEFSIWEGLAAIPPYNADDDLETGPAEVEEMKKLFASVDAIIFATPEYNSSVPGALKNALDWASRPLASNVLRNKLVTVIGASPGLFGAVWAQAELRKILAATGARVVGEELAIPHSVDLFDADLRLIDDGLREDLSSVVEALFLEAKSLKESLVS